ncbi:OPT oligopeptide transporter protein [Phanerochaete sordida]|uniref:OPT oligopeptide transporter protein n=1 Tax=Phanerochaete sordida TaxID=48140 RepID=A0A9P3FXG1_9APHY|nr:OPT oligopeptide transporter protein [Phanerochaete sordida]
MSRFFEKKRVYDNEKQPSTEVIPPVEVTDPNLDEDEQLLEDDSPYPEVRSAVANTDDPDMPCATLRAWFVGLIWAIIIPGLDQFFFFRYPSVTITGIVAQLISFPIMRVWARVMPRVKIFGMSLNPGPFTIKEHVIITIMANVGSGSAYATDIIAVQRVFYNQDPPFGYSWLLVMSTQLIGFSIGGIARRFLVQPPSMIWPANLVTCTLFNTLHSQQYAGMGSRGGMSRELFFLYVFIGSFCWYFAPGYLFGALSYFNWICWIVPDNVVINQLFGTASGLGMSILTFDWAQITFIGSPLATPWWAEANIAGSVVFFFWILTPILYYTNTWYSQYMPISSTGSYDNTGSPYNVTQILTPDSTFDIEKYKTYSPLFLSTTFALSYGLSFASVTATIMHTFLYYRKQIWVQARRSMSEQPDIHARLMSKYPQVPEWWYVIIFAAMFVFGVVTIEVWNTEMPVWAFILALCIAFFYILPIGIIQAVTNQQVGLNVITELIIGYALPGRPIAMMMFKTWGYITMSQALLFTSDFKLGHYMKVPPRPMFACQVLATAVAGTVQLAVQSWVFTNIPDICTKHQKDGFSCPSTTVFGTASIIWGVIGPARQFSAGQIYNGLLWFFLIGAAVPVLSYFAQRRYPNSFLKYLNWPVIFTGTGLIPPATPSNYVTWCVVGFIFNFIVRRRNFSWWTKYNYVLSAGLDSGLAISTIVIFFCLQFPDNGNIGISSIQAWWGNNVYKNTADWNGTPLKLLAPGATFGPSSW